MLDQLRADSLDAEAIRGAVHAANAVTPWPRPRARLLELPAEFGRERQKNERPDDVRRPSKLAPWT